MRVGVYIRDIPPEEGGGHTYERDVLDALAEAAPASRHELMAVSYAANGVAGWSGARHVSLAYPHRGLPARARGRAVRTITRRGLETSPERAERLLRAASIDLLWCIAPGCPAPSIPYVTTIWDLQHRKQPVFPEVSAGTEWADREAFFSEEIGRATRIIVGNRAGRDEVQLFYGIPAERIAELPHPTPSFALTAAADAGTADAGAAGAAATAAVLERHHLEPGYVFYPAQLWSHKNHVGLLRALKVLEDEHGLRLPAVFVGSNKGNEAHVREVARQLGLGDRVHFLGFVSREELVALYRGAFALAYVTFFGPENLPPLEAFALGCPVVASAVDGSVEQLGDAALLAGPTDEAAIAAALFRLHEDPAMRARLIEKGSARARAFTSRHYVKGMLAIVDELEGSIRTWR